MNGLSFCPMLWEFPVRGKSYLLSIKFYLIYDHYENEENSLVIFLNYLEKNLLTMSKHSAGWCFSYTQILVCPQLGPYYAERHGPLLQPL